MTIGSRSGAVVGLDARPRRLGVGQWFDGHRLHHGDIELTGDLITAVDLPAVGDGIACPGYIDLQINGFRGTDALTTRTLDMVRKFMQLEKAADTLIPAGPGSIAAGQRLAGSQVEL